jgi:hypothetical protein
MNYTKPELSELGQATDVIESQIKGSGTFDGLNRPLIPPAYDLDE